MQIFAYVSTHSFEGFERVGMRRMLILICSFMDYACCVYYMRVCAIGNTYSCALDE